MISEKMMYDHICKRANNKFVFDVEPPVWVRLRSLEIMEYLLNLEYSRMTSVIRRIKVEVTE